MKFYYVLIALILFSCGGSEDNPTVQLPVANNDTATTKENTQVIIDVLTNDTLRNNASLDSFDSTTSNGGSVIKTSNRLAYTPADNFTGTDTFTYTICDALSDQNCATATVTITVTDTGNPVAVDDVFEVDENTTTIFETLLDNDEVVDGATLTSIDAGGTTGTVVLNNDNTVTYTATNGFSGVDTFTYTLCDTDATPSCSTATVSITVIDEGNPAAVDDNITVLSNQLSTITDDIIENDTLLDDANIASIAATGAQGSVVLNMDGSVSYQPPTDFTGEDMFSYTICDDDATPSCSTATVTINVVSPINFNIPSELQNYYNGVLFVEDTDIMFDEIEDVTVSKHTTILTYTQRHNYLYDADEDLTNAANVILVYSGESRDEREWTSGSNPHSPQTFNTEHIYPRSLLALGDMGDAFSDLHHLRSCDATVNSDRVNYRFVDGTGTYQLIGGNTWFPGDEWKGDVARMILYLNVRYGETFSKVGALELFLKWNREDPVSAFEEQRNEVIFSAQGNRNPFIDNPYLATLIWGGDAAENKWE
ncbi:MAG: Ig-like domain-containing protein [Jejuia sp.]